MFGMEAATQETLSSFAVNGTKATFYDEVQVIEAGVDFECHQVVEVTVGVEYAPLGPSERTLLLKQIA